MMMGWTELVDVSSCIMFEAAGDSEADSDINDYINHLGILSDNGAGLNDDDAMSCSCDGELRDMLPGGDNLKNELDEEEEARDHDNKVYEDDEDDDEDDAVNQILKPRTNSSEHVMKSQGTNKDFRLCSDSTIIKFMDDTDRDKLFWETCLAS